VLGPRPKGVARYIWEICKGLDKALPNAEFFLYSRQSTGLPKISPRWHQRADSGAAARLPNSLWAVSRVGILTRGDNLNVFWGGTGLLPLAGLGGAGTVLTVHDIVYKIVPHTMSARARWTMKMFFEPSLARAQAIVTNSSGTAERLNAILGYDTAAVVRPGLSSTFRPQSEQMISSVLSQRKVQRPFLLGVGTWEPRKGLELLVQTFSTLKTDGDLPAHSLVLAGERGWRDRSIADIVGRASDSVAALGFVEDIELAALYSACDAFVFPSIYEGFGMPVLEARACGAPVVTSNSCELREAGGSDAIYVQPTNEGVRAGILAAVNSRKSRALDWSDHSWHASASILATVLTNNSLG
jgi:glycosyltransferase involved in cell wall biosynthesis